ncbi:NXPE family member 3 [Strongylocentrotus purpuratus]|uniref:NXPE C-terminal domain-containing protein n=1 Tax=Strongylocentrotus purpuratus TaxID=7668 RepID=A0A7M7HMU4_STRPU|nr:NXPE family member 3 [Strongylocentrotus purpuratus]
MSRARRYGVVGIICLIIMSVLGMYLDNVEISQTNLITFSKHDKPRRSIATMHLPSSCGPTHPNHTTVSLVSIVRGSETIPWSPKTEDATGQTVVVGDKLKFSLEARDVMGRLKILGGDYWFAIMEDLNKNASTVGRIVDHENGLYTLLFVAGWSGMIRLRITLVHPAELAKWIRTEYLHSMRAPSWSGLFKFGEHEERSPCSLSLDAVWSEKCVAKPKALQYAIIVCNPPKTLPCDTLVSLNGIPSLYTQDFKKRLPSARKKFLQRPYYYTAITNVPSDIFVTADDSKRQHLLSDGTSYLPRCEPGMDTPLTEGYWWNRTWFSLTCGPRVSLNKANVHHCLHDTNIYFTGDSTTRQWFAAITEALGLGQPEDHERAFLLQRRDKAANLNLTFIFHPLTAHPQQVFVNLSTVKFEADVILELPRHTCRNVVVFSPWAHFSIWQWEAYTDWLKGIRAAILVAKQRCPDLLFVYKSPHPVDKWSVFPARDVVFNEMRALVRDIFEGLGVIFVDIWDINLGSPWPITLHMPSDVIDQEVSVLLSYLCPLLQSRDKKKTTV